MFKKQKSEVGWKKRTRGVGVTHISTLFSKYTKTLKAPQGSVITVLIDIIKEMYGFTLKKEQCIYQTHTKTLVLHIPGTFKSEILLQKDTILSEMSSRLGEQNAPKNIL
jgi:hypothetical protein